MLPRCTHLNQRTARLPSWAAGIKKLSRTTSATLLVKASGCGNSPRVSGLLTLGRKAQEKRPTKVWAKDEDEYCMVGPGAT